MEKLRLIIGKYADYAPVFVRVGLSIVFTLFSFQKLFSREQTVAEIEFILSGLGPLSFMAQFSSMINLSMGVIEGAIAMGLFFGIYVRYAATLASLLLFTIFSSYLINYKFSLDPSIYRDLGLLGAAVSLIFTGAGPFSFDSKNRLPHRHKHHDN